MPCATWLNAPIDRIAGSGGGGKCLGLVLHQLLPRAIAGAGFKVLADSLLGRQ